MDLEKAGLNETKRLPWRPRVVETREIVARQRMADCFPACGSRLPLKQLGGLLGAPDLGLRIRKMAANGLGSGQDLSQAGPPPVLVALSGASGPQSGRAVLALSLALARELVDRVLGRPARPMAAGLTSGEQGALLYALDRAGADWLDAQGAAFRVRGFLADPEQIRDYLGEAVRWRVFLGVEGTGLSGEAWLCLAELPEPPAPPGRRGVIGAARRWPVVLRVSVGRANLAHDAVKEMEAGDIVVLDEGSFPWLDGSAPHLAVSCGAWKRFGLWLDRRRIALVSDEEREDIMATRTGDTEEMAVVMETPVDAAAAAMEVIVEVEIGVLRMTVESAAALVPGQILRLDREVGPEVVLKVGEKRIGRGELVEHEGRLAVEVTEVP